MAAIRHYGTHAVAEAGAVTATRLARELVSASQKGKANPEADRKLGRVALVVEASRYLSRNDSKDLLTYLSLL